MRDIELTPDGQRPVVFSGELIGRSSSHLPGKLRWFELELYRTDTGRYVARGVGLSDVVGEDDKEWVIVTDDANELVDKLHRRGDAGPYLPRTTQVALSNAAEVDGGIAGAYRTRI